MSEIDAVSTGRGNGASAFPREAPRRLYLVAIVGILLCFVACHNGDDDGLVPECQSYVAAYARCLQVLKGDENAHARQVENVRASLKLEPNIRPEERAARQAECTNANERLTMVCK